MNFYKSPSFLSYGGSRAYGLNTEQSDVDLVGFVLPPKEVLNNIFQNFEEWANKEEINTEYQHLVNPANPKLETKVYSLKKFFKLASECNPNIIEILWVDPECILKLDSIGEEVLANRDIFLSKQAKFRFLGYAHAQFQKIERHRKWLIKGEIPKPERKSFGLPEQEPKFMGEIYRLVKAQVEEWNFHDFGFDEEQRNELKERLWDVASRLGGVKPGWGDWPEIHEHAAAQKIFEQLDLVAEIQEYINREIQYKNANKEYINWLEWKKNRNVERKGMEAKFGFDLKHAMHLIRLARTGYELLLTGKINTTRPDREELLAIRNGEWSYERLLEEFKKLDKAMDAAYSNSVLPHSTDKNKINQLYYRLLELDRKIPLRV
jgi:uncharacterized protein